MSPDVWEETWRNRPCSGLCTILADIQGAWSQNFYNMGPGPLNGPADLCLVTYMSCNLQSSCGGGATFSPFFLMQEEYVEVCIITVYKI